MKTTLRGERRFLPLSLPHTHTHAHTLLQSRRYVTSYLFICRWVWSMVVQWKIPLQGYQYNAEVGNQSISLQKGKLSWELHQPHYCNHWYNIRDGLKVIFRSSCQATVPSHTGIKWFPLNFKFPTVSSCCWLQTACLLYTMLPYHHFVSSKASPCFQRYQPQLMKQMLHTLIDKKLMILCLQISSLWILPFAHVISSSCAYSLGEFIWCGGTLLGWWNDQRMWVFKRTTSHFFGFSETILKLLGFAKSSFAVTSKVADEEESKRFEKEVMEFGAPSPIFTILATLALLNLFAFIGGIKRMIMDVPAHVLDSLLLQLLLCGVLVFINLPVYQGLFLQKDASRVPYSVTYQSIAFTLLACSIALY